MPSTLRNTLDGTEEVSAQGIVESEAGPSRHPLRSKKPRQNLPYARTQKQVTRKSSEEEQGGFFSSVKNMLSLKWLRNPPSKPDVPPVVGNQEKSDSDSEQSVNMDTADVDNHDQVEQEKPIEAPLETIRSRKDLVIDSDKGKKPSTKNSEGSLYPRVPSFDSSIVTPLRTTTTLPVVEASQVPSSKTQNDADIIEYVRRVGRESLAKKQTMVSDDLYASKSPFRFAKQRSQASTRTPSRAFGAGINSVGRRPFAQNLSPGSPGSEQQTKRRKTVEPRSNEVVDRLGTPQFPFTPSEARRIMENIESISSPFSEAKRSTVASSTLRKSVHNKSILLEDDIAPPTRALSVPLSLPGLPYSKGRRGASKTPSRLSEVSEFLSSVNEKKKKLVEQLEAKQSIEPDTPAATNESSADEASTQEVVSDNEENPSSKNGFSFGSPVALSEIKAPPLPVEFKRTEVEKPTDDSSHTLKKYSLKMKSFSTRQHGSSNRFSARDEDLNSDGEENEALKTVAPAPLLNTSSGFSFGTEKSSATTTTLPSAVSSPAVPNKSLNDDIAKDNTKESNTETVAKSTSVSLQPSQSAEVKSSTLSGFSFGSSKANEDSTTGQSTNASSNSLDVSGKIPALTTPSSFSFGSTTSPADTTSVSKPEATDKSEKTAGFSFGSTISATKQSEPSVPVSKDDITSPSNSIFGSLESKPLEATPSTKSAFSFGSLAAEEPKTATFSFGASTKPELVAKPNNEDSDKKETAIPSFSFGTSTSSVSNKRSTPSEEPKSAGSSNSTFTFGTPSSNEKSLGFGSQPTGSSTSKDEVNSNTTGGFTFTSKSETNSDISATGKAAASEKSEPKTTGFTFGASSATSVSQPEAKTGGFTFGDVSTPLSNKPESSTISFGFGTKESSAASNSESKPSFSFGATVAANENKSESKPGFSFGGVAASTTQEEPKATGFTFGGAATSTSQAEPKSNGFTFDSTNKSDTKTTGFTFGTPASASQSASLVTDASTPVSSSSSFTFGTPATTTSTSGQPGFTFGASSTETTKPLSSFSFGASSAATPEVPKATEENKPSFGGFGSTATSTSLDSKPPFTFGTSTATTSTPGFGGFGTSEQPASTTVDSKPSPFTFGSSTSQPQSSGFTFGAPTPQTTTPSAATQSQATPAPFTFGSSNSGDAMSSTPPTGFGGFGSSISTTTTPNSSAPFTFGGNNGGQSATPSFGFGASTTSQPSSVAFGNNNTTASTSSFTFGSSGNTGFGASATQPQAPVFGGNSTPAFGAPQPAATQPSSFTFGSGNSQTGPTPGNFNFSAASSQPAPFAFGASTPAPQASFGFGSTPAGGAPAATPGGFNMGTSTVPPGRKIARPKRRTR